MSSLMNGTTDALKVKNHIIWWQITVLLIAGILRLVALQDVPPGLAQDEVRNADIVQHIRQGEHALFFRTGLGHEPLYHYFSVPFQVLLGDNVLSIRLPAIVLGLLLIAVTMRWVRRDFGWQTAVFTGLGLAIGWQTIIFSRLGLRPIMEPLLLVIAVWFWHKRPLLAGLFLGLTLYTYTAARVLFALPILIILWQLAWGKWVEKQPLSPTLWQKIRPSLIVLIITILLYLPLHFALQADPTLQGRVQVLEGPLTALKQGNLKPILELTGATLGVFSFKGPPRWTYTISSLPLFNWGAAIFFYLGLFVVLKHIQTHRYLFVLVWLGVGLIPSAITPHAPSIIRIIGAAPIIYLLPALALSHIHRRPFIQQLPKAIPVLITITYFVFLAFHTIHNGFVQWPQADETHQKYQTVLQEIGHHWQANASGAMVVVQENFEPIQGDTVRRNLGYENSARWVHASPAIAGALVIPPHENSLLYIPDNISIHPALLQAAGLNSQSPYHHPTQPAFTAYTLPNSINIPQIEPQLFDNHIALIGYQFTEVVDNQLQFFTYWRVINDLTFDLTIFTHLVDANDTLLAQHDGLNLSPSTLSANDIIIQRHLMPVTAPLPENYSIRVGLYKRESGQRLLRSREPVDYFIVTDKIDDS